MPGSPLPQEDNKILLMHRARLLEVQAAAATHFAEVANPGLMPPDILPNGWWESERQSAAKSNGVAVTIGPAHENMDVTAGRMPPVLIRRGQLCLVVTGNGCAAGQRRVHFERRLADADNR